MKFIFNHAGIGGHDCDVAGIRPFVWYARRSQGLSQTSKGFAIHI
jgi:hypothetical protein